MFTVFQVVFCERKYFMTLNRMSRNTCELNCFIMCETLFDLPIISKIDSNIICLSPSQSVKLSILFVNIVSRRREVKQHQAMFGVSCKQQNKCQLLHRQARIRSSSNLQYNEDVFTFIAALNTTGILAHISVLHIPSRFGVPDSFGVSRKTPSSPGLLRK